jgi:hypothetical protein
LHTSIRCFKMSLLSLSLSDLWCRSMLICRELSALLNRVKLALLASSLNSLSRSLSPLVFRALGWAWSCIHVDVEHDSVLPLTCRTHSTTNKMSLLSASWWYGVASIQL